jgi:hypothetical protein
MFSELGIGTAHFGAGFIGCEHPFDAGLCGVALSFPDVGGLHHQYVRVRNRIVPATTVSLEMPIDMRGIITVKL